VPVLHQRDRFGRDVQWIEIIRRIANWSARPSASSAFTRCRSARAFWAGLNKYPVVAKHAFTFLFNQAEFGLGCPINVTDGCAKLLANFGSEALKDKYLDGLTQTDMEKLTQGGQFMTEKEGGSDFGTLTTTAVQKRSLAPSWREMVLLERRCKSRDAIGAAARRRKRHARRRPVPDATATSMMVRKTTTELFGSRTSSVPARWPLARSSWKARLLMRWGDSIVASCRWPRWSIRRDCPTGVKSTALMRRAYHDAMTVAKNRVVFGSRIVDLPLGRRQLMKIILATEQALSMSF